MLNHKDNFIYYTFNVYGSCVSFHTLKEGYEMFFGYQTDRKTDSQFRNIVVDLLEKNKILYRGNDTYSLPENTANPEEYEKNIRELAYRRNTEDKIVDYLYTNAEKHTGRKLIRSDIKAIIGKICYYNIEPTLKNFNKYLNGELP